MGNPAYDNNLATPIVNLQETGLWYDELSQCVAKQSSAMKLPGYKELSVK